MRPVVTEKRFYLLSAIALAVIFAITLIQNIIRYSNHGSYSIWTSIIYLLVSVLLFIPVIVLTVRLQKYLKKRSLKWFWPMVVLTALLTLGLFYIISNIILHSMAFFNHYVDQDYARYYFGREALYHLLMIIGAAIFVWTKTWEKRTVVVSKGRKTVTIPINQVEWIEVEGHYLNFYTEGSIYIKRERLGSLAKELAPDFLRIHRKFMVNKGQIQSLERDKRDEYVVLNSGKRLKVGQSFKPVSW